MWLFQRSGGAEAWKDRAFSRRCAASKWDRRCFHLSGSYQISYSWREIGQRPRSSATFTSSRTTRVKMILTATRLRSLPQVWWLAFLWLRPSSTAAKGTSWFQCAPRSPSHAGKCARPPFVRLSSSPASIWTYVLSALPSLSPANFMSLLCIKKWALGVLISDWISELLWIC